MYRQGDSVGQVTPGTLWEGQILREPLKSNTQVLCPFFLMSEEVTGDSFLSAIPADSNGCFFHVSTGDV